MDHILKHCSSKRTANVTKAKVIPRLKLLKLTMLASFPHAKLQKIVAEQVCQALRASFAVATYAEKGPRVRACFCMLFRARQNYVATINMNQFLQTILNYARRGAVATLDISTPSVPEVRMFFHSSEMIEKVMQRKAPKCFFSYSLETTIGYNV